MVIGYTGISYFVFLLFCMAQIINLQHTDVVNEDTLVRKDLSFPNLKKECFDALMSTAFYDDDNWSHASPRGV